MKTKNGYQDDEAQKLSEFVKSVMRNETLFQILKQHVNSEQEFVRLQALHQSTVLSDEDWKVLETRFTVVFGEFLQKLRMQYPELSSGEVRFLSLIKLGFSKHEMALLLGIAAGSLRVIWYRIRKKLEISGEVSAQEFVAYIK